MSKEINADWEPLTRNYMKEQVARYRKAYPKDKRTGREILECINKIEAEPRSHIIMFHWAVAQGGFTQDELYNGRLSKRHKIN